MANTSYMRKLLIILTASVLITYVQCLAADASSDSQSDESEESVDEDELSETQHDIVIAELTRKLDDFALTLTEQELDLLDEMLSREECTEQDIDAAMRTKPSGKAKASALKSSCGVSCRRGSAAADCGARRCKCKCTWFGRAKCKC